MVFSNRSFAVLILVQSCRGEVPLVRDFRKPKPHFFKLPGGKGEIGETPKQTAWRELREETGIEEDMDLFKILKTENRGDHDLYLFGLDLEGLPELAETGTEGEEVIISSLNEIRKMGGDFFLAHFQLLREANII